MRYLMTFSYDGTNYNGYQKQPHLVTIQQTIETALTKLNSNNQVSIYASGRTDSKVHALNQKAHFDLIKFLEPEVIKKSLNSLLPHDIYVKDVMMVSDEFHARYDVLKKEYIYKINIGEYNPLEFNYVFQYNKDLNISLMKKAIKLFEGEHDFSSFTEMDKLKKDYIRKIYDTNITLDGSIITITFIGNGFLRYMVRNMVGLLIEIGALKKDASEVSRILQVKDRKESGIKALPNGLYLKNVYYN